MCNITWKYFKSVINQKYYFVQWAEDMQVQDGQPEQAGVGVRHQDGGLWQEVRGELPQIRLHARGQWQKCFISWQKYF